MNLRYFYHEYKYEFVFGILLSAAVVVSYMLSPLIPADIYRKIINPAINCFIISFCGSSAWFLARHHDGIRVRKFAAIAYAAWTVLLFVALGYKLYHHTPDVADGILSMHGWEMVFGNVFAWLLLAYPTELLRPKWLTWWKALLQLVPVVLIGLIQWYFGIDLRWVLIIYPMAFIVMLFLHIRAYRQWCENNYASMEAIDAQWIWRYLTMCLIAGVSYTYMCFLNIPTKLFTEQWLLFFILFYSTEQIMLRPDPWKLIRRPKAQQDKTVEEEVTDELAEEITIDASSEENKAYKAALDQWMETEKPYLDKDFRASDMMQVVPINRTYLSQFLKAEYGCNFYQYVTNYRVAEAKRVMRENPQMSLSEVGERCGFASLTVFGRVFARETGLTPSEWNTKIDNK